jgi:hypothetical protein
MLLQGTEGRQLFDLPNPTMSDIFYISDTFSLPIYLHSMFHSSLRARSLHQTISTLLGLSKLTHFTSFLLRHRSLLRNPLNRSPLSSVLALYMKVVAELPSRGQLVDNEVKNEEVRKSFLMARFDLRERTGLVPVEIQLEELHDDLLLLLRVWTTNGRQLVIGGPSTPSGPIPGVKLNSGLEYVIMARHEQAAVYGKTRVFVKPTWKGVPKRAKNMISGYLPSAKDAHEDDVVELKALQSALGKAWAPKVEETRLNNLDAVGEQHGVSAFVAQKVAWTVDGLVKGGATPAKTSLHQQWLINSARVLPPEIWASNGQYATGGNGRYNTVFARAQAASASPLMSKGEVATRLMSSNSSLIGVGGSLSELLRLKLRVELVPVPEALYADEQRELVERFHRDLRRALGPEGELERWQDVFAQSGWLKVLMMFLDAGLMEFARL